MPFPLKLLNNKRKRETIKSASKHIEPASSGSSMHVSMDRGYSYTNLNLMQAKPKLFPAPLAKNGTKLSSNAPLLQKDSYKFMAKTLYASFGNPDRIL